MDRVTIYNDVDFSDWVAPAGETIQYESVQGRNTTTTLDGVRHQDELAIKAVVTVPFIPLTTEQLQSLLSVVLSRPEIEHRYWDLRTGGLRTMTAQRNVSRARYRGKGADGKERWSDVVVTTREM